MVIIGALLAIFCGIVFICYVMEAFSDTDYILPSIALFLVACLGIFLWVWDVNSPIEEVERVFVTSYPEKYNINVTKNEDTLVKIKETIYDPTNFGAIWNESTIYELVLEEE